MIEIEAVDKARACFLEGHYGCAEAVLVVLQEAYGLEDAGDSSPAMALNGGVAWSGNVCGSLTGAAIAIGRLAARRLPSRSAAKHFARLITARCLEAFRERFGAINCRELIGQDIYTQAQHAAFVESGLWRTQCLSQVEFVVQNLYPLHDEGNWQRVIAELSSTH